MENISVELRNINLRYSKLQALNNINLKFQKGSIHALIGEQGSGKTSIAYILSGLEKPDSGKLLINHKAFPYLTSRIAVRNKIKLVNKNIALNKNFTAAENLIYSSSKSPIITMRFKSSITKTALDYIYSMGFNIDVTKLTKNLTLQERNIIAVLAQIIDPTNVLILDEILDTLSIENCTKIVQILNLLKENGCTIIIISNKIDRTYDLADTISIIKDNKVLLTENTKNIGKMQIVKIAYTQYSQTASYQYNSESLYQLIKYNEAILEDLPANLIIVDNKANLKLANKYFINNFKISIDNYIDNPVELLFNKTSSTSLNILLEMINNLKEEIRFHVTLNINDIGGIFNIHSSPIVDMDEKIGYMVIFTDITFYNSIQENNQLNDKLSSIGLLSAGVAHEINNPLEIIGSYLTNIKFKYNDAALIQTVNKLYKQVNYITNIVSNLQNFSTTEKIVPENTNINTLIIEIVSLIKVVAQAKNIKLIIKENHKNLYVFINENELKQVILNILKNAFESIVCDGEIIISTQKEVINKIIYNSILFTDSGSGIDDTVDYFNPFFSTKSRNNRNTGLGLSLSYGIVTKYNGSISLKNRTDGKRGCIVTLTFPEMKEAEEL